jgi:hypothetical protein
MKGLERENARLKKLVADLALLRPAAASATLHAPGAIASEEGKQIGVGQVSMGERHAVRIALVDLQRGILHQFG